MEVLLDLLDSGGARTLYVRGQEGDRKDFGRGANKNSRVEKYFKYIKKAVL